MIDIHSHLIPKIDDGSSSFDASLKLIDMLLSDGVTDIILTPHYRGEYHLDNEKLNAEYENFKKEISKKREGLNLYLGAEVYGTKEIGRLLDEKKVVPLANSNYVLVEFPYFKMFDVLDSVSELLNGGYIPVVAHVERYGYLKVDDLIQIREMGGLIQVNATSIVERDKLVKKALKLGLVNFVGSDIHEGRKPNMKKAYIKVSKKYGKDYADAIFNDNALEIITKERK